MNPPRPGTRLRRITDDAVDRAGRFLADDSAIVGLTIDTRYEVLRRIARGGMGEVYFTRDIRLGRPVAMKVLSKEFSGPQWTARFQAEARTTSRIEHPGVVPIHDFGSLPDGRLYYTMRFITGRTLSEIISAEPDRDALVRLLVQTCSIVQYAHDRQVIHRDLKPQNVMVDDTGHIFVLDWGIARVIGEIIRATQVSTRGLRPGLTSAGIALGTLDYMPPEQAVGDLESIDARSDVFSLGAILYEMTCMRPPVVGADADDQLEAAIRADFTPPRGIDPAIPVDLEAICLKALKRHQDDRYPTARALAEDLSNFLAGRPVQARPLGPVRRLVRTAVRHRWTTAGLLMGVLCVGVLGTYLVRTSADLRRRREAQQLLESARPELERAARCLYDRSADYPELARRIEEGQRRIQEAVERDPSSASGHHLLGRAWELRGLLDRAVECWRRALVLDPGSVPIRYSLGRALLSLSYLETLGYLPEDIRTRRPQAARLAHEAAGELQKALSSRHALESELHTHVADAMLAFIRDDPERVRQIVESTLARFAGIEGVEDLHWVLGIASEGETAIRSLDRAIEIRPKHTLALISRGMSRFESNLVDAAIADFSEAIRINPHLPLCFVERGCGRARKGDLDAAIADFNHALTLDGRFVPALINRSQTLRRAGRLDEALADAERAVAIDPRFGQGWLLRGIARKDKGDPQRALFDFDRAIDLTPTLAEAFVSRGNLRRELGQVEEALADLDRALSLSPLLVPARFSRASLLVESGRPERALSDYDEVIASAPGSAQAHVGRGTAHFRINRLEDAILDFSKAVQLDPALASAYANRGVVYQIQGRLADAARDYADAIRLDPKSAVALANLGSIRLEQGDPLGAIPSYDEAIRVDPKNAAAWSNRGRARLALRDYPAAIGDFTKAIELDPSLAAAFLNRALAHEASGNRDAAVADAKRALEVAPAGWAPRADAEDLIRRLGEPAPR